MLRGRADRLKPDEPRLEYRFRYDPVPLPWFDNPRGRMVFRDPDPEHGTLELLCGKHLAGWQDRPTGAEMAPTQHRYQKSHKDIHISLK